MSIIRNHYCPVKLKNDEINILLKTPLRRYNELGRLYSIGNLEKCLTVKTFSDYKNLLTSVYASNEALKSNIISIVDKYYSMK